MIRRKDVLTILLLLATFLLTILTLTTRSPKKVLEILLKGVAEIRGLIVKIWAVIRKSGFSKIFISATISIIFVYLIMLLDTNSIMRDVKSIFMGTHKFSLADDDPLNRYDDSNHYLKEKFVKVELTVIRLFVLHDFRDGYIFAFYRYEALDENGKVLTGSMNIFTKWKIHKENGKWKIIEIFERA
jgi:hypothetical protein